MKPYLFQCRAALEYLYHVDRHNAAHDDYPNAAASALIRSKVFSVQGFNTTAAQGILVAQRIWSTREECLNGISGTVSDWCSTAIQLAHCLHEDGNDVEARRVLTLTKDSLRQRYLSELAAGLR